MDYKRNVVILYMNKDNNSYKANKNAIESGLDSVHVDSSSKFRFGSELEQRLQSKVSQMLTEFEKNTTYSVPKESLEDFLFRTNADITGYSDVIGSPILGMYSHGPDSITLQRYQATSAIPNVRAHEENHRYRQHYGLPQDESLVDAAAAHKAGYAYPDRFQNR